MPVHPISRRAGRLLGAASLVAIAAAAAPSRAAPQSSGELGRPVILMLHGRGMLDRDTADLRRSWLDALRAGAGAVDGGNSALVRDGDVRLVWYADILDPRSTESCSYASSDPRARRAASIDPDLKNFASMVGNVLGALTGLVADPEAGVQLRALAGDAEFLSDAHKRCATESRLATAIDQARREGRPIVLVAHSLGALVAYDYLSSRSDSGLVRQFVTLGSPVGSPDLRHMLIGGDSTDSLVVPRSVGGWINIRNEGDPLAAPLRVGREIVTRSAAAEVDPHEMVGYLRNRAAAAAVLAGWCGAFALSPPAGCSQLTLSSPSP